MLLQAACGAEGEVKVVEGNEALEGCPATPAASEQRKKNGWTGTPGTFQSKFSPSLLPFLFSLQRFKELKSPQQTLCRHSFDLPQHGPPVTPASPHTGHWRLQSQGSGGQGLPTGQLVGAQQPELSKGERSCVKDKPPRVDGVPYK